MVAVLIRPWHGVVEGVGSPGEAWLPQGPLVGCVERAAEAAGMTLEGGGRGPVDERLVLDACTAVGPGLLGAALTRGREHGGDCLIELGGISGELHSAIHLGEAAWAVAYLPGGGQGALGDRIAEAPTVLLDPLERSLDGLAPGGQQIALTDRFGVRVRHWVQLLWANLLGLAPHLWRELVGRGPVVQAGRLVVAALRARSLSPQRVAGALSRVSSDASVHPSAVVEGAVIGPGARVGAQAVVRGSVLGPEARVEELAICEGCVLGPRAVVQRQAMAKFSVIGEGAMLGGVLQLGLLCPRSGLRRGAFGMDQALDGPVRVARRGQLVPAPLGVAGICVGEDTTVGCGVRVAPGRALPAGMSVVAEGSLTSLKGVQPGGGVMVLRGGRLEPGR